MTPCKRGHTEGRYSNGACKQCNRDSQKQWALNNPDRYVANYQRLNARFSPEEWRAKRKPLEHRRALNELRLATSPEARAAKNASEARRRCQKMLACPSWANHDAIKQIYAEAVRISRETGVEHHVDHVVPLRGRHVCGLHVENNLQILPWQENLRKSFRYAA